jgi:hypothetical protein
MRQRNINVLKPNHIHVNGCPVRGAGRAGEALLGVTYNKKPTLSRPAISAPRRIE